MILAQPYLRAVIGITSAGGFVSALELLWIQKAFRNEGQFSWKIAGKRFQNRPLIRVLARACSPLLAWPTVVWLIALRAASSMACIAWASAGLVPAAPLAVFVVSGFLLFIVRAPNVFDGAEAMMQIAGVVCFFAAISGSETGRMVCLFFLSGQLSLAYGTAGAIKLKEAGWRDGSFLTEISATGTFGRREIYNFLSQNPAAARWISRSVVLGEIAGSVAPWCPPSFAMLVLAGAGVFHLASAIIMGLNTYAIAFAAVFPAALYTSRLIFSS